MTIKPRQYIRLSVPDETSNMQNLRSSPVVIPPIDGPHRDPQLCCKVLNAEKRIGHVLSKRLVS